MPRRSGLALAALAAAGLALMGSSAAAPPPGFLSSYTWSVSVNRFGGFSAIELSPDGRSFTALSDRGSFVQGQLQRNATGLITGVKMGPILRLKATGDTPLRAGRNDSEGLAIVDTGEVFISFEGVARVLRYAQIEGPAENLPIAPAFAAMQKNASLEALAIDAKGRLYTLPESNSTTKPLGYLGRTLGADDGKAIPIYRFSGGAWDQPFALARIGDLVPVAADFGPDGRLYILERGFAGISGFASRVRSFAVTETALEAERVEFETSSGVHDNLEGLSVWQDAQGRIRLTMISDDNFNVFQRTEIVEYVIPN